MKICFICNNVSELGGIQRVLSVISNELSNYHKVDILCLGSKKNVEQKNMYKFNNVKISNNRELIKKNIFIKGIFKLGKILNKKTGIFNFSKMASIMAEMYYPKKVQERIKEYINNNKYDIVVGVAGEYSLLLGIISDKLVSKTIGWQHNSFEAYFRNKGKYYWNEDEMFKRYLSNLYKCVVLTNIDKEDYKKNFNIDTKVIYNPLSFCSEEKTKCNKKNIVFAGRLEEYQKGLDLLIDIFKKINDKNKEWKLNILGDGEDKEKLKKYIQQKDLEKYVNLLGRIDDVKKYFLESSIFVSTSRWEGFGLVITEAMECGLPVVAFDNSGPKEIINKNEVNGILVPNHDIEIFAEKLFELINNEKKRKSISYNAILRAKDFNVKNIIKEWNNLFEEMKN